MRNSLAIFQIVLVERYEKKFSPRPNEVSKGRKPVRFHVGVLELFNRPLTLPGTRTRTPADQGCIARMLINIVSN